MPSIVVPFRAAGAKLRLAPLGDDVRRELALAMLGDVLSACRVVAPTTVVSDDPSVRELAAELDVAFLTDSGVGQGAAVAAALEHGEHRRVAIVNADLPCIVPHEIRVLLGAVPPGGLALIEAVDGTTNALALDDPSLFAPLYGPGSADRFRAHARELGADAVTVVIPNLATDVDTLDDLRRVRFTAGPRTQAATARLGLAA
jgi:2-phospho-L-lactate/phosphoenolpyruvate guanylyltransferase